jgi:hypothetical protein
MIDSPEYPLLATRMVGCALGRDCRIKKRKKEKKSNGTRHDEKRNT